MVTTPLSNDPIILLQEMWANTVTTALMDEAYPPAPNTDWGEPAGISNQLPQAPTQNLNPFILKPSRRNRSSYEPITPMKGFKFGCDPELFILNEKGVPVSAEGLIPGTKEKPYKVPGGAVQVDGMAAEFNIDPQSTYMDFNLHVKHVMAKLLEMLPKGYSFSKKAVVVFSQEEWDKAPDKAKELGCTPDFNAWTSDVNPPPHDPGNPLMRTASGHIHLGWTEDEDLTDAQHLMNCRDIVKQLDWYVGGWSTLVDPFKERRNLYGKAGACRYKPYGVEYRVLSNFWLFDDNIMLETWNRIQKAIFNMKDDFLPERQGADKFNLDLIEIINTSKQDKAFFDNFSFPLRSVY